MQALWRGFMKKKCQVDKHFFGSSINALAAYLVAMLVGSFSGETASPALNVSCRLSREAEVSK